MRVGTALCLLVTACWQIASAPAHAAPIRGVAIATKERPSHIPLPPLAGMPDVTPEAFQKQLEQLALEDLLQRVAKDPKKFGLDGKEVPRPDEMPKLDLNDPRVKKVIEDLLKQYEGKESKDIPLGARIPPEQLESLKKKALEQLPQKSPTAGPQGNGPGKGESAPDNPGEHPGTGNVAPPTGGAGQSPVEPQNPADSNGLENPQPSEEEKKESERNKALAKALETFKDSKSLGKAIESLTVGNDDGPDALGRMDDEGGFDWDKFGKESGLDRAEKWMPRIDWKWPDGVKLPEMKGPKWEMKTSPALPSTSGGLNAGGSILAIFLVVLLVIVLGLAAWKLRNWFIRDGAETPQWRLGPWPVQPALVRTREELIRAFEYLSLLRLGRAARNWNHRHIAAQLGVAQDAPAEGREAAARLASLYEHARYAPTTDELEDAEFEAARRDLTLLAGVPGA